MSFSLAEGEDIHHVVTTYAAVSLMPFFLVREMLVGVVNHEPHFMALAHGRKALQPQGDSSRRASDATLLQFRGPHKALGSITPVGLPGFTCGASELLELIYRWIMATEPPATVTMRIFCSLGSLNLLLKVEIDGDRSSSQANRRLEDNPGT